MPKLKLKNPAERDEVLALLNHQLTQADLLDQQITANCGLTDSTQGAIKALVQSSESILRNRLIDSPTESLVIGEMVRLSSQQLNDQDALGGALKALMTIQDQLRLVAHRLQDD